MIPGIAKTDIYSYVVQVQLQIKVLIKDQLKEMQPAKVIMMLCKITLGPEGVKDAHDLGGNTRGNYIRVEMPLNSLMAEFFEGSDMEELIQLMFIHIKTQVQTQKVLLH